MPRGVYRRNPADWTPRFQQKIEKSDACWNWAAAKNDAGYGQFSISGTIRPAHRISYEMAKGPIPAGLHIDHLCRNRGCVNPAHIAGGWYYIKASGFKRIM